MRTREEQETINKACKFHSENINELRNLVADSKINLGDIDTSRITDMSNLFFLTNRKDFSGIEKWDTSNVTNMRSMFLDCTDFNQPLNDWDVSKVKDMSRMFLGCEEFNEPLNDWDVSNVTDMSRMFCGCKSFNQSIEHWNVSNVKDMTNMFYGCKSFNFPLWNWNINNVSYCWGMFINCESFKENLNTWKLPRNYEFNEMFEGCYIPKENLPQGITFKEEDNSDILLTDEVKGKLDELPKEVIEQFLSQLQVTSVNQENEQVQENVVDEVSSEEQQCEQVDVPASLKSNQDLSREF